jgi:hypothetical protein
MTEHFSIPAEALENHIGILGKTGSGKSNAAKVIAERLIKSGQRVCSIDPTGTWWGIRLDAKGKRPSPFPVVIFGGEHADIPISPEAGAAIAEAIGSSADSTIIDTRQMTVGGRTKFFTAFAEALLRTNKGVLHLIIDEAHIFAPQGKSMDPQAGQMLAATNNLVSLGRGNGLRIILISQRPAKLHKDSLTQVETLVAMRLIAPQDRKAAEDWMGEYFADASESKKLSTSLMSLPVGSAWLFSPVADYLKLVQFPLATTFDSGRVRFDGPAPKLGQIDVRGMADKLVSIKADVVANDPARLKAEIAALKREIASHSRDGLKEDSPKMRDLLAEARRIGYREGDEAGYVRGYELARKDKHGNSYRLGFNDAANKIMASAQLMAKLEPDDIAVPPLPAPERPPARAEPPRSPPPATRPAPLARPAGPESGQISLGAERKPLGLLVSVYPGGYSEAQWATLAGYKRTGGTWGTYKSRLRAASLVEQRDKLWYATEAGIKANGGEAPDLPRSSAERIAMWKSRISGVGSMLDVLAGQYPLPMDRQALADRLGMTASGGTFGTYLSRLRSNGIVEELERGVYRLTESMMEELP